MCGHTLVEVTDRDGRIVSDSRAAFDDVWVAAGDPANPDAGEAVCFGKAACCQYIAISERKD
jgi:hypothetical protein